MIKLVPVQSKKKTVLKFTFAINVFFCNAEEKRAQTFQRAGLVIITFKEQVHKITANKTQSQQWSTD